MKLLATFACFTLLFVSCSKDHNDENIIEIRVANQTASKIIDVKVYSFEERNNSDAEKFYGTINGNTLSHYIPYSGVAEIPVVSYKIDGAGTIDINKVRCASPELAKLQPGKYTLRISGDYISPDVSFVKD